MAILEVILGAAVLLILLFGLPLGAWRVVHIIHHKHRLEQMEADRQHRKLMAEDFAQLTKELSETVSFQDYMATPRPKLPS